MRRLWTCPIAEAKVFNGDTDPCVSYEGTRTAIEKVGYAVVPGGPSLSVGVSCASLRAPLPRGHYRPWFYDKTAAEIGILKEPPVVSSSRLVSLHRRDGER